MPTNLPPDYFEVEKRYRSATSAEEKIICLQDMLSVIPKHKGTDKLRGDLRRKLSKLKASSQARKGISKRTSAYSIDKEGAGLAVLVGLSNVGKSALLATLTNADPEVANVPFTTWSPTPGMMPVENIQVQLVDTPSLNRDFVESELMDLIRRSDILLLVVDLKADPIKQLEETVDILREHRITPIHQKDQVTEVYRHTFKPIFVLVNKYDDEDMDEIFEIFQELLEGAWPLIPVSASTGRNLEELKRVVFECLDVIRVYSKAPGREPDYNAPFILKSGSTVDDFAGKVHQDFLQNLKFARVWGSAAFEGQMVGRDYVLHDGDVVELRI
ncbi:MAG TPA: TGS domain-containing protein [Anaerolineae bacterium]|nr:TGS domain-containing protein [Anaerolineae bacterium]